MSEQKLTETQLKTWKAGNLKIRCMEYVYTGRLTDYRCTRNATVERDDMLYCKTHDPVRVKERRQARNEKWEATYKQKDDRRGQLKAEFVRRIVELDQLDATDKREDEAATLVDEILSAGMGWWR